MDDEDLELFARSLRHAMENHDGPALDAALAELGWPEALAADPRAAVPLLFELQGETNAATSALDQVLGHDAVLLPAVGQWQAPGTLINGRVDVRGVARLDGHETVLVVAGTGDSHVAVIAAVTTLERRAIAGLDPSLSLVEFTGTVTGDLRPFDWPGAVALGQLALGHELVGAARRMLALAREHALTRVQFGRPIGAFQAVRHRLAETLVAVEAATAALDAAWLDGGSQAAAMAKATAARSARVAARHCQQVLAGIGFTTEHSFHRYVRRVLVLEQFLGAPRTLTRALGDEILQHRRLPTLLPL